MPSAGETVVGSHYDSDGGKGANQAVQMALLGAATALLARVGDDSDGQELLHGLKAAGVLTGLVGRSSTAPTGAACILVAPSGDKRIVVSPGANSSLGAGDIDGAAATIAGASLLLTQLEVPFASVQRAVEIAAGSGSTVVLNAAPACKAVVDLLDRTDVLVLNRSECALLSGRPVDSGEEVDEAARSLCALGARATIVTLGPQGARVVDGEGSRCVPPVPTEAVDPTGAGDAFCGAVSAALLRGLGPLDAAGVGVLAGALCAGRRGARASHEDAPRILAEIETRAAHPAAHPAPAPPGHPAARRAGGHR